MPNRVIRNSRKSRPGSSTRSPPIESSASLRRRIGLPWRWRGDAMRALRLDYQRTSKPLPWLGLGMLAGALAALALLGSYYQTLNQQIAFWESKADRMERLSRHREHASIPMTEQATRAQLREVKQANQVLRQLPLP